MSTPAPHRVAMETPLARSLPYPLPLRLRDSWLVGHRDAPRELAHVAADGIQPSASLRALAAELATRCDRELLQAVRIASPLLDEHREHVHAIAALQQQIDQDDAEIAAASITDPSAYERVPKNEAHLSPEQRAARRDRETARAVAAAIGRRATRAARLAERKLHTADVDARLETLFDGLRARVSSLTNHYERRAETQNRAYLRRAPGDEGHPLNQRQPFHAPEWALGENPWLSTKGDRR